ncbi:MAG: ATP-binding protein [Desulfobulbaceae bacterium]|nr:ATP-binding protein [Desulfobulbaceae bacterium]
MIHRIQQRLFLFIVTAATLAVACLLILQLSLRQGFLDYINMDERADLSAALIQTFHNRGNSWVFFSDDSSLWPERLDLVVPRDEIASRLFLLDANKNLVLGKAFSTDRNIVLTPLKDDGQILGYYALQPKSKISQRTNIAFVKRQEQSLLLISIPILLLSIILSLIAARHLLRPINALSQGLHLLSKGQYSSRVAIKSRDELGQLSNELNSLALILENNEKIRCQLVADIAHELRTPLTILRGEIRALLDGIRPTTPVALESLNTEVLHLNRMVDDLYQLSLYDISALNYDMKPVAPIRLLDEIIELFRPQFSSKGITISFLPPSSPARLMSADHNRLRQLFSNLLSNSLKHTDANGRIEVIAKYTPTSIEIVFQDSPPAVLNEDLPNIFNHLFRVDSSRNRATGGSGLGLTICRSIVSAHEGTITAGPSPLGGLLIAISLPAT